MTEIIWLDQTYFLCSILCKDVQKACMGFNDKLKFVENIGFLPLEHCKSGMIEVQIFFEIGKLLGLIVYTEHLQLKLKIYSIFEKPTVSIFKRNQNERFNVN